MSDHLAEVPALDPDADRYAGLPASWSLSARETYVQIDEERELTAAERAALYEACQLLAFADTAQDLVDLEGLTVAGSTGQTVAHPLIAEIRQARTVALTTLRALAPAARVSPSAAGSALASARHRRHR